MLSDAEYVVIETKLALAEDRNYLQQKCRGVFAGRDEARRCASECFRRKFSRVRGKENGCEEICSPDESPDEPYIVLNDCDGPQFRWKVLKVPRKR